MVALIGTSGRGERARIAPGWMRSGVWGLWGLCGAWLVFTQVRLFAIGHHGLTGISGPRECDVVVVSLAVVCLARAVAVRAERSAWLLIAVGMLLWSFGELYYNTVLWSETNPPSPSPADGGYLAFYVLSLVGLMLLVRARSGRVRKVLWADGLTTALSVGALSAALVFGPVARHESGDLLSAATDLAYPLLDLLLVAGLFGALARVGWRLDRVWLLLTAGYLVFWLGDSMWEMQVAQGTYQASAWYDISWYFGFLLIAAAAWQPPSAPPPDLAETNPRSIAIPLAFALLGLGVLVYGCARPTTWLAVVLAAASLAAVIVRVVLMFVEDTASLRREALSDQLTGLGNRRALIRRLEAYFETTDERRDRLALVLLDLDGFKSYNDRFGHPAGDALLARLAGSLRDRVGACGEAFRIGGDEFCALIPAGDADGLTSERVAAALSERGDGFHITSSHGTVTLPDQASSPSDALRIADTQMYAHKRQSRRPAGDHARELLTHMLADTDGRLAAHAERVAQLAAAIARQLGLSTLQAQELQQAAELHDIGKIAIPYAILQKPGPLSDHEQALVHQHPAIGERLAAALQLVPLASVIRHTLEHFDGTGYPDAVAGEQIPLAARIIAVAVAYDAMTSPRPQSASLTSSQACSELRRCSGTRFDPTVVQALINALDA